MQRLTPLLVGVLMTWLTPTMAQTPDYIIQSNTAPLKLLGQQAPKPAVPATAPRDASATAAKPQPAGGRLRVGLLLPTGSATLGEAAAVVRSGVEAAARVDQNAELVPIEASEDTVVAGYKQALASGVNVVIGPLSRGAIAAVAPAVTVPTLALNSIGREVPANPKLFSLSLIVEGEARQVARLMYEDGRANPLLLFGADSLSQRLRQAFIDEWRSLSRGKSPMALEAKPDSLPAILQAAAGADAVFMALDAHEAGIVKAALAPELPVYGTSQLNGRGSAVALAGVRVIDMPWFLMPEHPAVKRYPRPAAALTMQTERLYALGVDAWRLAVLLAGARQPLGLRLDGVTGDLRLGRDRLFERQLPMAVLSVEQP